MDTRRFLTCLVGDHTIYYSLVWEKKITPRINTSCRCGHEPIKKSNTHPQYQPCKHTENCILYLNLIATLPRAKYKFNLIILELMLKGIYIECVCVHEGI